MTFLSDAELVQLTGRRHKAMAHGRRAAPTPSGDERPWPAVTNVPGHSPHRRGQAEIGKGRDASACASAGAHADAATAPAFTDPPQGGHVPPAFESSSTMIDQHAAHCGNYLQNLCHQLSSAARRGWARR